MMFFFWTQCKFYYSLTQKLYWLTFFLKKLSLLLWIMLLNIRLLTLFPSSATTQHNKLVIINIFLQVSKLRFLSFGNIARYGYAKWTYNVHIYIYIEHRNLETRKNTYDFLVQVRNFLLPLSSKVLRHKERDTHSFYSGFFICPHLVRTRRKASASKRKSTVFFRGRTQLN